MGIINTVTGLCIYWFRNTKYKWHSRVSALELKHKIPLIYSNRKYFSKYQNLIPIL